MKATALFFAMLACLVGWVSPQEPSSGQDVRDVKISVDFHDMDVREAVRTLFAKVGARYEIDPALKGTVTADYRNVTFEEALRGVLDQVGATFARGNRAYRISMRVGITTKNAGGSGFEASRSPIKVQTVNADVRDALRLLFRQMGTNWEIDPNVQGKVTVDFVDMPFETALRGILDQVDATYRVEAGQYSIIPRSLSGVVVAPPDFYPGTPTGEWVVRNKSLYLTPHRTIGGTYDLLSEAIEVAGYERSYVYRYGSEGFALVLPVEALDGGGRLRTGRRWFVGWPDVSAFDFRQASKLLRREPKGGAQSVRVLVLLVSSDRITPDGFAQAPKVAGAQKFGKGLGSGSDPSLIRFTDSRGFFSAAERHRVWSREPKLTVLLYEVAFKDATGPAALLKPGESAFSAKAHIIDAGLWTAKQLR